MADLGFLSNGIGESPSGSPMIDESIPTTGRFAPRGTGARPVYILFMVIRSVLSNARERLAILYSGRSARKAFILKRFDSETALRLLEGFTSGFAVLRLCCVADDFVVVRLLVLLCLLLLLWLLHVVEALHSKDVVYVFLTVIMHPRTAHNCLVVAPVDLAITIHSASARSGFFADGT